VSRNQACTERTHECEFTECECGLRTTASNYINGVPLPPPASLFVAELSIAREDGLAVRGHRQ
jgi:hypothetical protein